MELEKKIRIKQMGLNRQRYFDLYKISHNCNEIDEHVSTDIKSIIFNHRNM